MGATERGWFEDHDDLLARLEAAAREVRERISHLVDVSDVPASARVDQLEAGLRECHEAKPVAAGAAAPDLERTLASLQEVAQAVRASGGTDHIERLDQLSHAIGSIAYLRARWVF